MDYSKLTLLKNKFRLTRKEFAEILGVTVTGLDNKLNNQTFTVKDLEILSSHLRIPISYFFGEKYTSVAEP